MRLPSGFRSDAYRVWSRAVLGALSRRVSGFRIWGVEVSGFVLVSGFGGFQGSAQAVRGGPLCFLPIQGPENTEILHPLQPVLCVALALCCGGP